MELGGWGAQSAEGTCHVWKNGLFMVVAEGYREEFSWICGKDG